MTEIEQEIYRALREQYEAVYLIDKVNKVYEPIKTTPFWENYFGQDRSLHNFFGCIYTRNAEQGTDGGGQYEVFVDETFFEKERHQGSIVVSIGEEKKAYFYQLVSISKEQAGFIISPYDDAFERTQIEKQKIDTIQENYLFSMIVNLKEDRCINSNTTEVGGDTQNFMDLKYSDWRNMISNMFQEEDRKMFFTMSSPEYVIHELEGKKQYFLDVLMMNMVGQYVWVRLTFQRMKGFSRENPIFVYTVQDIDEQMRKLLNQENIIKAVEEQNKELIRADQAKNVFLSNMSHEIRTPINAVIGMNEMIIREAENEKIRAYAHIVKNASKLLLSIINDILDFSKIESGKMEIIPVEYDPRDIIRNTCNLVSAKLREKSLEFRLKVSPNLPSRLYGDEVRITQVITNLLTNAVKYTHKGSVTFTIDVAQRQQNRIALLVSVKDTGIGMKEEEMDKLFSAFVRLDEKRNRNIEGTGLGMSIVSRLLEQMGSKIEVSSVYGEGSDFHFVLEQEIVDHTPIGVFELDKMDAPVAKEQEDGCLCAPEASILVIDDNRTNLMVIKALLKRTKVQVTLAESGAAGIEKLKEKKFDLVLLDHLMPGMDGIETLARIRQMGEEYVKFPVIALTANVISGAKDYYVGVGFNDYLEKPVEPKKMEEALRMFLPKNVIKA